MLKIVLFFISLTSISYAGVLDFLKAEKPLSFEKFIFKNSVKGPIVMNLRPLKKINKEICGGDFSIKGEDKSACTFQFVPPNTVKILLTSEGKEEILIYDLEEKKIIKN